ncbi:hypothetical protein V2J09_015469 [Rumex salicifolius]
MNYLWGEGFSKIVSFSLGDDILIQKILITHNPDGRLLDSELCLRAVETIMSHASAFHEEMEQKRQRQEQACIEVSSIEVEGPEEPLGHTIHMLSREIICLRSVKEDVCTKPLVLFELLGKYRWDAKLSLVLSSFAVIYGEFWVIIQSQDCNRLALSISLLKELLPLSLKKFQLIFKTVSLLVDSMVALTRIVVQFERLPTVEAELANAELIRTTKHLVCVAAYWICRSVLICTSKLADIRASKDLQITSLEQRMKSISEELKLQVNNCQLEAELKIHQKLVNLLNEPQDDNQKVLRMLLSLKDDRPLKHSASQEKLGISELAEKVVLLLISKSELLPIDELLLLVQRINDNSNASYEIVWIPVTSSETWSDNNIIVYSFLSNSLPWYSVKSPWSLSPTTINHIKKEWKFNDQPIIVALDPGGQVSNSNAIDMGWIWGAKAFPFSTSKEEELWSHENSIHKLLVDSVSPLLSMWAEQGRVICIYGSDNIEWISEFIAKMNDVQKTVEQQLEVVYVGKRNPDEKIRNIMASINSNNLTWNGMQLFWIRLESMRRSILRLGKAAYSDPISRQVEELIKTTEIEDGSGWMIVGKCSSTNTLKLRGQEVIKALNLFPESGFVNAIRGSMETHPEQPCNHSRMVKYDEATEESLICENCGRPMNKFIVFDKA